MASLMKSINSAFWSLFSNASMQTRNMSKFTTNSPAFRATIEEKDKFYSIDIETLLKQLLEEFPEELERLKRAYSVRDDTPRPTTMSPSMIIYGKEYDEVNRTLVGVLALRWLVNDEYDTFVSNQPAPIKLRRSSFDWLRKQFMDTLHSPIDLYALVLSVIINDLGKDPELATEYHRETHEDISGMNHDMILLKAVQNTNLIPSLNRLPTNRRTDIELGMELGAEFNFGQLAQAENVPACLSGLLAMRGHPDAFQSRFMEQLLDMAGAAGHQDHTCAKKLIEPIYQAYFNVHAVASGIISGALTLRQGYDTILTRRNDLLVSTGAFRKLNIHQPQDRALMRLHCIAGAANHDTASLYDTAFNHVLDRPTRATLTALLNRDGSPTQPAVQPTYIPAMLARGIAHTPSGSDAEKIKALVALLRYLARVLTVEGPTPVVIGGKTVGVIEREVRTNLVDVLGSEAWRRDPEGTLEGVGVPRDEIAKGVE